MENTCWHFYPSIKYKLKLNDYSLIYSIKLLHLKIYVLNNDKNPEFHKNKSIMKSKNNEKIKTVGIICI